jgi:hypothetical protein
MKQRSSLSLLLMPLILVPLAPAQITVKMYQQAMAAGAGDKRLMNTYLAGAEEGLGTANAVLSTSHQPLLYCAPDKLPLNVQNLSSIIDDWIVTMKKVSSNEEIGKLLLVGVLLDGLTTTFPCQPQKP